MERGDPSSPFPYNWQVMIKKRSKMAFALSELFWKYYCIKNEWCKKYLQKTSTNEDNQSKTRNYHPKLLTSINCNRIGANQLLQEYILIGLILLLDSTEDVEGLSELQVEHSAIFSYYPQFICLCSFMGIFYEIWTSKLKASLTSTDRL